MIQKLQRSVLFPRDHTVPLPNAGDDVEGLEKLWLDTDQGDVEAWFLPAFDVAGPAPAVIAAHGNAELIDKYPEKLGRYRELGYHLLIPEYRGYGRSDGDPSQARITQDFVAFHDILADRDEVDIGRVVYHGRSLGGAVVAQLATVRTPRAMILESTFTSVVDFARQYFIPRALIADPFDTRAVLNILDVPLLIFHGTRDSVVPFEHGRALAEAAKNAKFVSYDADHNDFPPDADAYWNEIETFLKGLA
jgi:fermentation-respiration switch protein FrsA (DUF1100 family)